MATGITALGAAGGVTDDITTAQAAVDASVTGVLAALKVDKTLTDVKQLLSADHGVNDVIWKEFAGRMIYITECILNAETNFPS